MSLGRIPYRIRSHPAVSAVVWLLLLLVVVAVAAVAVLRQREAPPARPAGRGGDDLTSLGLSEVRARPVGERSAPDPTEAAVVPPAAGARAHVTLPAIPDQRGGDRARPAAPRVARAEGPWEGEAVPHLLASLAAHVGGRVAVVRHDGDRFRVEARSDGGALEPVRGRALGLRGPATLRADELGGLAALVGLEARAVPLGERVVLVSGEGPAADRYLDLLAALTPGAAPEAPLPDLLGADLAPVETPRDVEPPADPAALEAEDDLPLDPDDPDETGLDETGLDDAGLEAAPVPRAVLIGEEQAAAREAGRPLAFALVTLADAEERLMRHAPEAVSEAEAALRDRLEAAPDVRRVEPFGDLLFGAFLGLDRPGAAAWCKALSESDPPLFIGAVAPADGDPAAVRAAAVQALQDAYDQRGSRVVEV